MNRSFEEDQQRARQVSGPIQHGQFMRSQFAAKPTPSNTGLDALMRLRMNQAKQQQEAHARQHLRELQQKERMRASIPGRLLVPVSRGMEPIITAPTIGPYIVRRRRAEPKIVRHQVSIRFEPRMTTSPGIVIYGKCSREYEPVPVFIIKTGLVKAKVYTDYPSELKPTSSFGKLYTTIADPHARCKADPAMIDLTQFDNIRSLSNLNPYCDAVIANVGGDFAFLGGTGAGLQIVIIVKGGDQGVYVYRPAEANYNIGLMASAGISTGTVYFNEKNKKGIKLGPNAFAGYSQGLSGSYGPLGVGITTSYADEKRHYDLWNMREEDELYTIVAGSTPGMGIPLGRFGEGVIYSFSKSELWASFAF